MTLTDALDQYNETNALSPSDPDYLQPPATVTLADALDLLPDAWADEISADAEAQGCTVSYTAAAAGLRAEAIARIQRTFAERDGDPDWQDLSEGQRLDECFPDYNGIGWPDLLDELGITPVYLLRDR